MIEIDKYDFSFTAASLRLNDLRHVAIQEFEGEELDYINDLGSGKSTTGKRMLSEYNKRLKVLTKEEKRILIDGDLTSQKQIAFLSVCKVHAFIRDFVIEVVREKVLIFDYDLRDGEYLSFFRRKNELHPEMDKLTDITQNKVRQVAFKILEQAGIIDSIRTKVIQHQIMDEQVKSVMAKDNKQWLKIMLMSDMDINNIKI